MFMRKPLSVRGSLELTFLGTGDAFASHGRFQSAYIIDGPECRILMEAGPTALCAMKRGGFQPADIDIILISHLHGDHFGGLPFFLLEYLYESPRRTKLIIAGPRKLEERAWRLFDTMFPGSKGDAEKLKERLKFVVIEPGCEVKLGQVRISAMRTPHMKPPEVSLALRVQINGKTIVFSGDSGWTEEIVGFAAGADLFLCECTYFDSTELDFHMNYPGLLANHERFDVGRMILTHIGREVLERMGDVKLETADDGMKVRV
ncbi:MAG: MBL fold metallo-hydrolase [Candidatus Binataceae bacterium]